MAPPSWIEWVDRATRKKHATIADITRLKMHDKVMILCLDRNFGDAVYNYATRTLRRKKGRAVVDIKDMIKRGYGYVLEYEHVSGLCGLATWQGEWAKNRPPELIEFDLEYAPNKYYPLWRSKLPKGSGRDTPTGFEGRSWESFPKTRRVGWRGPCLFVKDLSRLPKKMYYDLGSF